MTVLRILFYAFLVYLAYKVIFDFVLPVYRATKKVRRGFKEMEEQMRRQGGGFPGAGGPFHGVESGSFSSAQPGAPAAQRPQPAKSSEEGDYIDFEEVK